MSNKGAPFHGVMEGQGAYNRYAKLPAGGGALALPLLEKAVRCVELDTGDQPVVIADLWIVSGEKLDGPHAARGQASGRFGHVTLRGRIFERRRLALHR